MLDNTGEVALLQPLERLPGKALDEVRPGDVGHVVIGAQDALARIRFTPKLMMDDLQPGGRTDILAAAEPPLLEMGAQHLAPRRDQRVFVEGLDGGIVPAQGIAEVARLERATKLHRPGRAGPSLVHLDAGHVDVVLGPELDLGMRPRPEREREIVVQPFARSI